jgi:hypothetical protein
MYVNIHIGKEKGSYNYSLRMGRKSCLLLYVYDDFQHVNFIFSQKIISMF